MSRWSRQKRRAIACAKCSRKAVERQDCSPSNKTLPAKRRNSRFLMPAASVARAPACWKRPSPQKRKRTCSASRPCCGGVSELIKAGFETLTSAGYQPEVAYFECLHELKLIVDLIYRGGLSYMRYSISDTAEQGDYAAGPRIVTQQTRDEMKRLLAEIRDGSFAKKWIEENEKGCPNFLAKRKSEQQHPIEQLGPGLRAMMPFLQPIVAPGLTAKTATSDK